MKIEIQATTPEQTNIEKSDKPLFIRYNKDGSLTCFGGSWYKPFQDAVNAEMRNAWSKRVEAGTTYWDCKKEKMHVLERIAPLFFEDIRVLPPVEGDIEGAVASWRGCVECDAYKARIEALETKLQEIQKLAIFVDA